MTNYLAQYFKLPEGYAEVVQTGEPENDCGYFRFGSETCYGQCAGLKPRKTPDECLTDALPGAKTDHKIIYLPFDLADVIDNLRNENYVANSKSTSTLNSAMVAAYYAVRPLLSVSVRRHLQKVRLRGWNKLAFPHWPVDLTVDRLLERLLLMAMQSQGLDRIPFIWFWPDGASSCAIMTHDVETEAGRDFCSSLMDANDRFGIKASFQVVPERRYSVPESYLDEIRDRGYEINVQDLNHDGHLYREKQEFVARVAKINAYGRQWRANGFRAAVLYRRQDWFNSFDFSYDMSVPNVAHLDPQRGGCCTVMPYFVGNILELPVTMTQDYSLFNVLGDYSIDLWKRQAELIMEAHGLMSFIVHPDYITTSRPRRTYEALLGHLSQLRTEKNVWTPLPGEVDRWWRQRAQMRLVQAGGDWRIEGSGHERALIAYASSKDGRLVCTIQKAVAGVRS